MLRVLLSLFFLSAFASSSAAQTHFHHVHLNSTDPRAAIEFYTTHLSGEKAVFDGADAVWTQESWLLFNKVKQPPPSEIVSPLFHIGWGAEDMKAEFERQIKLGTTFQTVLTDGVELFGAGTRDRNFFMYLDGPDHATIEVQSAMHHNFMHVHLLSDDPVSAAAWYQKHLGLTPRNQLEDRARVSRDPDRSLCVDRSSITSRSSGIRPRTRKHSTAGNGRDARSTRPIAVARSTMSRSAWTIWIRRWPDFARKA